MAILVRCTRPGRVALWERHPAHPAGEVLLHRAEWVLVGETEAVLRLIAAGKLERAPEKAAEAPDRPAEAPRKAPRPRKGQTASKGPR